MDFLHYSKLEQNENNCANLTRFFRQHRISRTLNNSFVPNILFLQRTSILVNIIYCRSPSTHNCRNFSPVVKFFFCKTTRPYENQKKRLPRRFYSFSEIYFFFIYKSWNQVPVFSLFIFSLDFSLLAPAEALAL